jgi:uncharacterized protein YabN with tetrapyrrole methylase and pyrophosphatase domain
VEEVLELDHALATGDADAVRDELGDVLLHLAFQIVLAEEEGRFGAEDLTRQVEEKMWRRHPHLFPDRTQPPTAVPLTPGPDSPADPHTPPRALAEGADGGNAVGTAGDQQRRWERVKLAERPPDVSVLDGLPPTLPPLLRAYRIQERAAGVGFDWPDSEGPRKKVDEELHELDRELARGRARDPLRPPDSARDSGPSLNPAEPSSPAGADHPVGESLAAEIGDVLFSVVNLARKLGVDPRAAMEGANVKFERRFRQMERLAAERGIEVGRATLEELDGLWEEVKRR